ncbi:hypothetical protein JCM3774_005500 [Rhodotorula dairenensis]
MHSLTRALAPDVHAHAAKTPVVVLDGGMGTTLQAPPFNLALDSELWSSELLATETGRDQLARLHDTWIHQGADIIQTCTYQSTLPLFLPKSDSPPSPATVSRSLETMTLALSVAARSATDPDDVDKGKRRARVALSLGPYGSALQPGQEYTGAYPPPFGPRETAAREARESTRPAAREACPLPLAQVRAAYPPAAQQPPRSEADAAAAERSRQEREIHLAAWHLQRLQHFATVSGSHHQEVVDVVAFETVPSLTEIRAIRKAMHIFNNNITTDAPRREWPFYISLVFPRTSDSDSEVRFPDPELGHLATVADQMPLLVEAALSPSLSCPDRDRNHDHDHDHEEGYAVPGGLGFNCTSPLHAQNLVRLLSDQVADLQQQHRVDDDGKKPWLLVYPDGGAVYDVVSRSWHHPTGLTDPAWARLVADAVQDAATPPSSSSPWAGVVVGGCCKAGPSAIKALNDEVDQRGWRR